MDPAQVSIFPGAGAQVMMAGLLGRLGSGQYGVYTSVLPELKFALTNRDLFCKPLVVKVERSQKERLVPNVPRVRIRIQPGLSSW